MKQRESIRKRNREIDRKERRESVCLYERESETERERKGPGHIRSVSINKRNK